MLRTSKGEYELKYTFSAMCEYEERFGRPLLEDLTKTGFCATRDIVWAGLLHTKTPAFTIAQTADLIEDAIESGADLIDIRTEIIRAVDSATFIARLAEKSAQREASRAKARATK